jgi:hypothetical protein
VSQQLTLCFDQKASLFCSSLCEAVNQLKVSGVAMFAPPDAVGDYNAPTGGNYRFIASVLGCLKHVPRNPHTRGLAIVRFAHDARHSSGPLSYAPIHALLSAEVQSMMTHFSCFLADVANLAQTTATDGRSNCVPQLVREGRCYTDFAEARTHSVESAYWGEPAANIAMR